MVGRGGPEYEFVVEAGKVREFATAVRSPRAGEQVPTTFPAYAASALETFDVVEAAGLDIRRVLHGEQAYDYARPLRVGNRLRCSSTVTSDEVKQGRRGGSMRVLTLATEMVDATTGELVVTCRARVIETGGAQ